jgi:hypothetical protein
MAINVCPIAVVNAPLDKAWRLLAEPEQYAAWWDAQTLSIAPPGLARAGQVIRASSRAFGRTWPISIQVNWVDFQQHWLDLTTHLPLGISLHNHITCAAIDERSCQIAFG